MRSDSSTHIIGSGLVGSLLATVLAKRGHRVAVFERRQDMRKNSISAGRSINLALSTRGIHALERAGLASQVLAHSIPMFGRTLHMRDGSQGYFQYGTTGKECIYSTSRSELNKILMSAAEATGRVLIGFEKNLKHVDFDKSQLHFEDGTLETFESVIGTDGSASALRSAMQTRGTLRSTSDELNYGYKEITLPPGSGGSFQLEKNSLHIWPRETFMLIALPNPDGSFTCTLFLAWVGTESFANLTTPSAVQSFFDREFPDVTPLFPTLTQEFFDNPTGKLITVRCAPWNLGHQALLLGDAAHAIVPFFGQGMNCGFEDVAYFEDALNEHSTVEDAFAQIARLRKPNADAIADLALDNFIEMRDRVADPTFQLERKVEKILEREFSGRYISRYSLVTFSRVPYKTALDAGFIEQEILSELCRDLSTPDRVDLSKARSLIDSKLAPLLRDAIN